MSSIRGELAEPRALLRPSDFAWLRVGYQPGPAGDTLRALGATPVALPGAAPWRGIDALEAQIAAIDNQYDGFARHLTANVPLWPRPFVVGGILMSAAMPLEALQALTPDRCCDFEAALYSVAGALTAALTGAPPAVLGQRGAGWS